MQSVSSNSISFVDESLDKTSLREQEENLKNVSESLQNNLSKTEERKENLEIKSPNITDCESPVGETSSEKKGISTSESGESISVSECNGHSSPVKEESVTENMGLMCKDNTENAICDENKMDQSPEEPTDEQEIPSTLGAEGEQGNGDASTNTGMSFSE